MRGAGLRSPPSFASSYHIEFHYALFENVIFITGSARPGLLVKPARSPHDTPGGFNLQKIAQGKILSPF